MANLGCQLAWIWNQLKSKPLGILGRDVWRGKMHPECGHHGLVVTQTIGYGRKKFIFCLSAFTHWLLLPSFLPCYSSRLLWDSNTDWRPTALQGFSRFFCGGNSSLVNRGTSRFSAFLIQDSVDYLDHIISKPWLIQVAYTIQSGQSNNGCLHAREDWELGAAGSVQVNTSEVLVWC